MKNKTFYTARACTCPSRTRRWRGALSPPESNFPAGPVLPVSRFCWEASSVKLTAMHFYSCSDGVHLKAGICKQEYVEGLLASASWLFVPLSIARSIASHLPGF